ncbi:MAG TPA: hypothetical protein VNN77_05125 [candidate division Zixibacteria bacterium]|nr:hypothetical protein [candidate division Zixibacteria bacterium]
MSRILVIEPDAMLRYAIASCLAAEHDAHTASALPADREAFGGYDAVIVGAGALREPELGERLRPAIPEHVPVIWVGDARTGNAPGPDQAVVLEKPLDREHLLSAVARALASREKTGGPGSAAERREKEEIIELVEVVEEAGSGSQRGRRPK